MYGPLDITSEQKKVEKIKLVSLGTSKNPMVNLEEMVLQEFKKSLMKTTKMTPEEFYRTIDVQY